MPVIQQYATVRYDKRHQIGVGQGMNSEVFLCDDPYLGREIVVKEIARPPGPALVQYFAEAQAMVDAQHPNVVPITYACVLQTRLGIAMPYFRRGSLQDKIRSGPIGLREGYRIAHGILRGLAPIEVAGIVHFDIKPSNVLISDDNEPLISDFGQARLMNPTGIAAAPALYPLGIPPEVMSGVGTVESDVYQVGLTLYRAFNGDPFFKNQVTAVHGPVTDAIIGGRFPNRARFLPHIPNGIRRVIRRAMKVEPADRYHSATEFQNALTNVGAPSVDWETTLEPQGEITWRASRSNHADLEVRLLRDEGARRWKTEIYTEQSGRRRCGVDTYWERDMTRQDAERHLKGVFEDF